jgi:hypothetical protein
MKTTTSIRVATAALIVAGALSPVALAAGEPKNDWPFSRSALDRAPAKVQVSDAQVVVGAGERKNQAPFTRPVAGGAADLVLARTLGGEAKNDLPFTQVIESPTGSGGFDWGDAGIGVAAGVGIAAILAGCVLLTYRGSRGRKIGAAATR